MKKAYFDFSSRLQDLQEKSLLRRLREFKPTEGMSALFDGKESIHFSSNDYLGLSRHPMVIEGAVKATKEYGTSCSASRLISGNNPLFSALERTVAQWKGKQKALIFPSGYMAALASVSSLVGKADMILMDSFSHASLWEGARLSHATLRVFDHNEPKNLKKLLERYAGDFKKILIITESLFSMDGDIAPLEEIVELKEHFEAYLLLDDAHAEGILGENGGGLATALDLADKVDVILGTFSKALGSQGGYVAAEQSIIDWMINSAKSFIFTTALSPSCVAAAASALDIIQSKEGAMLRRKLKDNISHFFEENLANSFFCSPIIPIKIGTESKTIEVSAILEQKGIYLPPIRYPTVPRGEARLRISLTAIHRADQIDYLKEALKKLGVL
ncbi:aminotransferase class I/II-fold pyridoxal phosphate-dependent enzyme [Methylacidiphilum caldifontis]|uniref:8-amino-7-oxononanoate synthase n=1 Tax=Methylacidiphilum caldifontis TaxID=2795386 RepID=A0A4Y8PBD9_9BACT|nr:8-amino-7-oxononanoate synthase [Methylacidiphilum caldifontis]TFE68412.1 8-amino-7-oxononanoate synthase [Methylacidiphilum caldifontis]